MTIWKVATRVANIIVVIDTWLTLLYSCMDGCACEVIIVRLQKVHCIGFANFNKLIILTVLMTSGLKVMAVIIKCSIRIPE